LNVILGYTELLLDGEFGGTTPEQATTLRRIDRRAHELLELINSTLEANRLEAGRLDLALREIEVPAVIQALQADTHDLPENPNVSLRWDSVPALPRLHTDPAKLQIVLKNLIRNAMKFTEQGTVTVAAHGRDDGVEITVNDTGIGITPEVMPTIFEPFRQGDGSDTRQYGGVGLGLYIARRLTTLLGGTIGVESEVGKGSTFRLWLPLRATDVPVSVGAYARNQSLGQTNGHGMGLGADASTPGQWIGLNRV
jgi:signal transduction histidine kinase